MVEQARRRWPVLIAVCCVIVGGCWVSRAVADGDADELGRRARNIAENINSPFCKATTLASCGSGDAAVWRADIRRWAAEGVPETEICRRLSARAGKDLCAKPSPLNGLLLPLLASALAIGVLALLLRRFVARPAVATPAGEELAVDADADAELAAELDEELAKLDDD